MRSVLRVLPPLSVTSGTKRLYWINCLLSKNKTYSNLLFKYNFDEQMIWRKVLLQFYVLLLTQELKHATSPTLTKILSTIFTMYFADRLIHYIFSSYVIFPIELLRTVCSKTDKRLQEYHFWQKTEFSIYSLLIWLYTIIKITVAHNGLVRLWTGLHPSTARI